MAEVRPFKGIYYDSAKVKGNDVIAPPYDIISPEYKDVLYERSPYNIVRIDFGKDYNGDNENENRYTRAQSLLKKWRNENILTTDDKPAFYCYETVYNINGSTRTLRGIMAAVKLEPIGQGSIYPHEMTRKKPKADRLNIMRHCMANISPIFSLYSDPQKSLSSLLSAAPERLILEAQDADNAVHRIWPLYNNQLIELITNTLADMDIFIADGHHRYETALEFKNELDRQNSIPQKQKPYDYVMMFLANMDEEGITLLPTHRLAREIAAPVIDSLKNHFTITDFPFNGSNEKQVRNEFLQAINQTEQSIGICTSSESSYYLVKRDKNCCPVDAPDVIKDLDVTILERFIFDKLLKPKEVIYEKEPSNVISSIKKGSYDAGFILSPPGISDVRHVSLAHERMPAKSTYFYPKLLTGMVINVFSE